MMLPRETKPVRVFSSQVQIGDYIFNDTNSPVSDNTHQLFFVLGTQYTMLNLKDVKGTWHKEMAFSKV